MRKTRKITSILVLIAMLFMIAAPAMAANTTKHDIVIKNEKAGHTYGAYQVFAGDISNGKLTNIEWGASISDGTALLTALREKDSTTYADCNDAESLATVLASIGDDATKVDIFAEVVGTYLKNNNVSQVATSNEPTSVDSTDGKYHYTMSVNGDGYYLVKDTATIAAGDAATKYILNVVGDVSVDAKSDAPSLDKIIIEADDGNTKGTSVDVGDTVKFQLDSKVPAMEGYDEYTYTVYDTMSTGLTFDGEKSVTVTIGGEKYTDFTVVVDGQSFKIVFNDFLSQKENAGQDIVITYTATLNEKALTKNQETNTVNLEYSHDPYDDTTKHTPDKTVYVFDFDIVIDKYTGEGENTTKLENAMFVLKNAEGKYYKYNAPVAGVSAGDVAWIEVKNEPDTTNKTADEIRAAWQELGVTVVTTDAQGAAKFEGLDTGNYSLKEIAAPAGYNLLKEDQGVNIIATYNTDGTLASSSAQVGENGQYSQTASVKNNSGTTLPSTGGIGTTIFYVAGAALAVGAGVLLVTRRRMDSQR